MSASGAAAAAALILWMAPAAIFSMGFVRRRDELWAEDAGAVGLAVGLFVFTTGSAVMARLGVLTPLAFWLVGAVLAALFLTGAFVLDSYRLSARGLADWGWIALPLLIALIASIPLLTTVVTRPDALPGSTPWYYWDLARQTAAAGGLPATSVEFGQEIPFLDDYPGFTAATAGLALASSRPDLLFAAHLFRALAAVGAGFGIWYLSRVWGAGRFAAAAAVFLLLATSIFATKLLSYRPEAAGYLLMLTTPALARRWLHLRQPILLVAASAGLAALGLVHGLAWIMGAILLLSTALVWLARSALPRRRRWAGAGLLVVAVFGVWALASTVVQGRITEATKLDSAPEIAADGTDPTWQFASLVSGDEGESPPAAPDLAQQAVNRGFFGQSPLFFWVIGGIALVVLLRRGSHRERSGELLLMTAIAVLGIGAISALFALGWDTYVPRRTGSLRLFQLALFAVPLLVAVASTTLTKRDEKLVPVIALIGAVMIWALVAGDVVGAGSVQLPPSRTLAAQRALELDGKILANGYTEGYLSANLGGAGALEGRAPYTNATLLSSVNSGLVDAKTFFRDPLESSLDVSEYDWVIAITEAWAMGTPLPFPVATGELRQHPGLRLVADHDSWLLFEVVR